MNRKDITPPCGAPTHFHDHYAELFSAIEQFAGMGMNAVGVCEDAVIARAFQRICRLSIQGFEAVNASGTLKAPEKTQKSSRADANGSGHHG